MPVFVISPLPIHPLRATLVSGLRHERFRPDAFETRDPHDPTSPRREASLFDSPGLLARRLFLNSARAAECGTLCRWWVNHTHLPAIDVADATHHMYFQS